MDSALLSRSRYRYIEPIITTMSALRFSSSEERYRLRRGDAAVIPRLISLFVLLGLSQLAHAEQGCPDGLYPGGAAPGQICVPLPGYGLSGDAQAQPAHWVTRWGAIATDDGSTGGGILGQSEALSSRRQAEKAALSDCRSKGGRNCALVQAYHDQCIAVAWGRSRPYSVSAENSKVASGLALEKCGQSDQACGIYYTGCSYPERVR